MSVRARLCVSDSKVDSHTVVGNIMEATVEQSETPSGQRHSVEMDRQDNHMILLITSPELTKLRFIDMTGMLLMWRCVKLQPQWCWALVTQPRYHLQSLCTIGKWQNKRDKVYYANIGLILLDVFKYNKRFLRKWNWSQFHSDSDSLYQVKFLILNVLLI